MPYNAIDELLKQLPNSLYKYYLSTGYGFFEIFIIYRVHN